MSLFTRRKAAILGAAVAADTVAYSFSVSQQQQQQYQQQQHNHSSARSHTPAASAVPLLPWRLAAFKVTQHYGRLPYGASSGASSPMFSRHPQQQQEDGEECGLFASVSAAARALVVSLLSAGAALVPAVVPVVECQSSESGDAVFAAAAAAAATSDIPKTIRERFLRYAHRVDGEMQMSLEDFAACMLMLPQAAPSDGDEGAGTSPRAAGHLSRFPPQARERLRDIFHLVDMDGDGNLDYAEFVVLFTFVSTRLSTFSTAFAMFDERERRRLPFADFIALVNTLLVDPKVRVVLDTPAAAAEAARGAPDKEGLTHTIPASLVRRMVTAPLPQHKRPPPGSKHNTSSAAAKKAARELQALQETVRRDAADGEVSYDPFWFRMDALRWELRALEFGIFDPNNTGLISIADMRRILSGDVAPRGRRHSPREGAGEGADASGGNNKKEGEAGGAAGAASSSSSSSGGSAAASGWFNFGSRGGATGNSKNNHKGGGDGCKEVVCGSPAPFSRRPLTEAELHAPRVTWQFYQTVFDIIRESEVVLPALRLALDAKPPVSFDENNNNNNNNHDNDSISGDGAADTATASSPASSAPSPALQSGAIPDRQLSARRGDVADLVRRREAAVAAGDAAATADAKAAQARASVRPTALTWSQFSHLLEATRLVPKLSAQDRQLLFELLDGDQSGTISPEEFAHICKLKRSFFAPYLPRFSEPRRNTVQQFFFCMQQLE